MSEVPGDDEPLTVPPHHPTDAEKIEMYEGLLHDLHMYCFTVLNEKRASRLIDNVIVWSRAHRDGNGEDSDEEVQRRVDWAFGRLREVT